MKSAYTKTVLMELLRDKLTRHMGVGNVSSASDELFYQAVVSVLNDIMLEKRKRFWAHNLSAGKKQVYYLNMEFLLGRSLRNCLFNLGLAEAMSEALESFGVRLENLYQLEPDAGLGNGGLGRLAACYLDAAAHRRYLCTGYSILYEFGTFKQKIIDGWQSELPDNWLPKGSVWLTPKPGYEVPVRFGGQVREFWENDKHLVQHSGYTTVMAVPYDLHIPGYRSEGISLLRLWQAKNVAGMDMERFNRGDFAGAFQQAYYGEAISKVLYPNDNHLEGKRLRLRQQYFLCAASISDICRRHLNVYGTLDNFAEKNAIHINDTHPTLAIPELMRFLLDDCGYDWEPAWRIVQGAFAYTNHTVMKEAMEVWDGDLFRPLLPRIYTIIQEIDRRHRLSLSRHNLSPEEVEGMAILQGDRIHMANLAVVGSHSVNGVSKLHSQILKDDVFPHFYRIEPKKFTNVTNGIASRRWLMQANPNLAGLIQEAVGKDFADDLSFLAKLRDFADDTAFLDRLAQSKRRSKEQFCKQMEGLTGIALNPDSIFDVHVKRIHEYKRQQLNALDILATYHYLKDHPGAEFTPRTYIIGGKAASGYYMAKQMIKFICTLADKINADPDVRDKMQVVFLEDYNVSKMEMLLPAADISQQISLAGTEASGTGNMKLMLNGAITLGTLDGANIEICEAVGRENILIFGMTAQEVEQRRALGYRPAEIYESNPVVKRALDALMTEFGETAFPDLYHMLRDSDYYMTLADFDAYRNMRQYAGELYRDKYRWLKMSLLNIAQSGVFSADRAIEEYARNIWGLER